jgi:hypothetical protein
MKTLMAVLAVALAASSATADPDRLGAMGNGAALSNAGDHAAAIALFEQAYLWEPDDALLPIIGTEYRQAGLPIDAISYFCQYINTNPNGALLPYATTQVRSIRTELGQTVTGEVCAEPAPTRVDFREKKQPAKNMSKREIAGIATAAFGVVSAAAGVYYGVRAREISDSISNQSPGEAWPDNIQALEDRGKRYEDRQKLFLLGGAAAIVTGGILYFTGRHDREAMIAPTVSADGAGISFARGF